MLVGLGACGSEPPAAPAAAPADDGLSRLDAAVGAVDDARAAVIAGPAGAVAVLTAFDDADEAAVRGDRAAAAAARSSAQRGRAPAQAALDDLPARLSGYRTALTELAAATRQAGPLDQAQRSALTSVAAGGQNEAAAVEATGAAVRAGMPAYDELAGALGTWLERARAGWYRTAQESAGGYALLAAPVRPALEAARAELARVERQRTVEVEAQAARLSAADAALAPLRPPA